MIDLIAIVAATLLVVGFILNYELGFCWFPNFNLSKSVTLRRRDFVKNIKHNWYISCVLFSSLFMSVILSVILVTLLNYSGIVDSLSPTIRDTLSILGVSVLFLVSVLRAYYPRNILSPYWLKKF